MKDYIVLFAISFTVTMILGVFVQIFYTPIGLDFLFGMALGLAITNTFFEYLKNRKKK